MPIGQALMLPVCLSRVTVHPMPDAVLVAPQTEPTSAISSEAARLAQPQIDSLTQSLTHQLVSMIAIASACALAAI
jgi:hypothetical protein